MDKNLATPVGSGAVISENRTEGRFHNDKPVNSGGVLKLLGVFKRYLVEPKPNSVPDTALPVKSLSASMMSALPDEGMHLVKLGHSSVLLKVQGEFWMIDPVFSERASPFSFIGPKRFHPTPISLDGLPRLNKVLISHNHYDHLDKDTIKTLRHKVDQFLVPLGVEETLIKWGVDRNKILSFDWWQELPTEHGMVAFTPAQHFSGRGFSDGNASLWGSWVIKSAGESVFFSGDSGYFAGFREIGDRYGPFDLTMIETGAYDKDWASIHMSPEESVRAHLDLRGSVMVPIHNGTFDLAFHPWFEPLERAQRAAEEHGVFLRTPVVGEILSPGHMLEANYWWRDLMPGGA